MTDKWIKEKSDLCSHLKTLQSHYITPGFNVSGLCDSLDLSYPIYWRLPNRLCKLVLYIDHIYVSPSISMSTFPLYNGTVLSECLQKCFICCFFILPDVTTSYRQLSIRWKVHTDVLWISVTDRQNTKTVLKWHWFAMLIDHNVIRLNNNLTDGCCRQTGLFRYMASGQNTHLWDNESYYW